MATNIIEDAEVPEGVDLFDPSDYESERNRIMTTIKDTLVKQFPKEYNGVRRELKNVDYDKPTDFSLAEQKKALHNAQGRNQHETGRHKSAQEQQDRIAKICNQNGNSRSRHIL